jgi:hypothetical protein
VQRDNVREAEHLVQGEQWHGADVRDLHLIGLHKRVVRDDFQPEPRRFRRNLPTDVAETNKAENLSFQSARVRDIAHGPPTFADTRGMRHQLAVEREQ